MRGGQAVPCGVTGTVGGIPGGTRRSTAVRTIFLAASAITVGIHPGGARMRPDARTCHASRTACRPAIPVRRRRRHATHVSSRTYKAIHEAPSAGPTASGVRQRSPAKPSRFRRPTRERPAATSNDEHRGAAVPVLPVWNRVRCRHPTRLGEVANSLEGRPRDTLGWRSPAETYAATVAMADRDPFFHYPPPSLPDLRRRRCDRGWHAC